MEKKVIVAGHICIDITPLFPEENSRSISELFVPGKLIKMDHADVHTGGAVANTGLAMKILGADAILIGKVGADAFGGMVKEILKKHNAAKGLVISKDASTSYSIVIAPPQIDRIFLHNPGANDLFSAEDVAAQQLENASLLHFGYPPLMKKMFQNQGEELVKLFRRAKACGVATSLDLAAVDADSEAGRADWEEILKRVLPEVDFFVPSVEELCFMLDRERFREWNSRCGEKEDITRLLDVKRDIKSLADRCMELGAKVLLLKCGAPGLYYKTAGEQVLAKVGPKLELNCSDWARKEGFEHSFQPEKVISGTGAGDTTIAAFLTAMLKGYSFERCIRLASATGASCVESYDALGGIRTFEELEDKIRNGWKKSNL